MILHLAIFAAGTVVGMVALCVGIMSGSKSRNDRIFRAGCARGRSDLKAKMIADALWHADNDRIGGPE